MVEFRGDAVDCLTTSERAALCRRSDTMPEVRAVLSQLARIFSSRTFARVHRATRDFLDFIISKTLIGRADEIKEMTVAIRVFGESTDFNPLEDSKIRVAGLFLRRRLAAYYAEEGVRDPVEIIMPVGTYVPRIFIKNRPRSRRGEEL